MAKRKKVQKKKVLFIDILKEYAALITIGVSVLAFLVNGIIKYSEKVNSTSFNFKYLTIKITNPKMTENLQSNYYDDLTSIPTVNNDINQLLYQNTNDLLGYYVTYLIAEQIGDSEANEVNIVFEQTGEKEKIGNEPINEFVVKNDISKKISETIEYPFPKGEKVKIPISICSTQSEYVLDFDNCYVFKLKPTSIEYKNKYLFSKRNVKIREHNEHNVIIDGEVVSGQGGN